MIMDEMSFRNWYWYEASPEDIALYERVEEFGDLFADMTFKPGTKPYELTKCQMKGENGEWINVSESVPEDIEYFDYSRFRYKVGTLPNGAAGIYDHKNSLLTVLPDSEDSVILHELIHLHEELINEQPMYFHDTLYWSLYQDLKKRIPALDDIINDHAHILAGNVIYDIGGTHDILFLLKSFDLDIRMNYPLGTVFGYGKTDIFRNYSYTV